MSQVRSIVRPTPRPPVQPLSVAREASPVSLQTARSFKVLQPSSTPAQLSLFPPPGLANARRVR